MALEPARTGATVALLVRSGDELAESARRVRAAGGTALVVQVDLGDLEQVEAAAERIRDRLGDPDVLVNNAAVVSPLGPSTGNDPAAWARAITINLTAVATEWIRSQDPRRIGTDLHERFTRYHADGSLIMPERSARSLVALLRSAETGRTWTVSDHTSEDPE